jgi:hypothetical protein
MWTYEQATGNLSHDGQPVGTGYSGHDAGVDNPAMEGVSCTGPLPCGTYSIAAPVTHPKLGPIAMRLTQTSGESFGRGGFFVHGDNSLGNESASEGCIILPRAVRMQIAASGDQALTVVA